MKSTILTAFLLILSAASLSACKTTVQDEGYSIEVSDGAVHSNGHGDDNFCPPGQAKKGHC